MATMLRRSPNVTTTGSHHRLWTDRMPMTVRDHGRVGESATTVTSRHARPTGSGTEREE